MRLSSEEQEFLEAGYDGGQFLAYGSEQEPLFIDVAGQRFTPETHQPLLDSLRTKGLIQIKSRENNSKLYILTRQGKILVERLRAAK